MSEVNQSIGSMGERAAARFLQDNGYDIIGMNFKNKLGRTIGEIDIIAKELKSRELVFVEVKTREYQKYKDTLPEENITPAKLRKLSKIASAWLNYKNLAGASYRFDAISVWLDRTTKQAKIKHIKSL